MNIKNENVAEKIMTVKEWNPKEIFNLAIPESKWTVDQIIKIAPSFKDNVKSFGDMVNNYSSSLSGDYKKEQEEIGKRLKDVLIANEAISKTIDSNEIKVEIINKNIEALKMANDEAKESREAQSRERNKLLGLLVFVLTCIGSLFGIKLFKKE